MSTTRDAIVATARRLFYVKGYGQTSLADLAADAGVPKGNFYYHFKSKDDVLRGVLEARRVDVEAALNGWRRDLDTPQARIVRMVRMMTNERDDLTSYGCPVGSLLTELGKNHPRLKADARATMELYVTFIGEQFRALGRPPEEARRLALRLLARSQGAVLMAHTYNDAALLDEEVSDICAWVDRLISQDHQKSP